MAEAPRNFGAKTPLNEEADNQRFSSVFNKERAKGYDKQREKIAALKDALHLCLRLVLAGLPDNAHILCIGVGTGAELIELANAFPNWQFTVVEPAAPMLDICRQQAKAHGVLSRCTFHQGYLDSLPQSEPFNAATCLLVSHFIVDSEQRQKFFRQIAGRLKPGGILVNADLAGDMSSPAFERLFDVWMRMLKYSDLPDEDVEKQRVSFGKKVAVLPPDSLASLVASSGFDTPTLFFQTLFIHAWYSRIDDAL